MTYPRQETVGERLHTEAFKALDAMRDWHRGELAELWDEARRELQSAIHQAYKWAAPAGEWTLGLYRFSGAETKFRVMSQNILVRFHAAATAKIKASLGALRGQSALRYAWVLDQVTPETARVSVPLHAGVREAGVFRVLSDAQWRDRLSQWVDGYHSALMTNLAMNAMNESALDDAMGEVDATRVNTPAASLATAVDRLFEFLATGAIAEGEDDVAALNDGMLEDEVWVTRGLNVCDACADNKGMTPDEADGQIPLHPNCRCAWKLVPKDFADLLRSGTDADRALARDMKAKGMAPTALVIRGEDGEIAAKAIVSFSEWKKDAARVLGQP